MNPLVMASALVRIKTVRGEAVERFSLSAGDETWGYYGRMGSLIDGVLLAAQLGLTAGVAINSDTPWLKFSAKGKKIFVPQYPLREGLGWEHIYKARAAYGTDTTGVVVPLSIPAVNQNARITIGNRTFRVRLLKGFDVEPSSAGNTTDNIGRLDSEINRLILPILAGAQSGQTGYDWDDFSFDDLGLLSPGGNPNQTLLLEGSTRKYSSPSNNISSEYYRYCWNTAGGATGVVTHTRLSNYASYFKWRPVLELIE